MFQCLPLVDFILYELQISVDKSTKTEVTECAHVFLHFTKIKCFANYIEFTQINVEKLQFQVSPTFISTTNVYVNFKQNNIHVATLVCLSTLPSIVFRWLLLSLEGQTAVTTDNWESPVVKTKKLLNSSMNPVDTNKKVREKI